MQKPKVILLDAVGTLFGVKGSVGEVYSQLARDFDIVVDAEILNQKFYQSFKAAPPPVFPGTSWDDLPQREFDWWRIITVNTFRMAGVLKDFSDFGVFFSELYLHFGSAEPWFVYPDVFSALKSWQTQGIELGILSNFDSRIYSVLQHLELSDYFKYVTIATQVSAAKPDTRIFGIALAKHNCRPDEAWHIGDSIAEDYQGAKNAGLRGIWINRKHHG